MLIRLTPIVDSEVFANHELHQQDPGAIDADDPALVVVQHYAPRSHALRVPASAAEAQELRRALVDWGNALDEHVEQGLKHSRDAEEKRTYRAVRDGLYKAAEKIDRRNPVDDEIVVGYSAQRLPHGGFTACVTVNGKIESCEWRGRGYELDEDQALALAKAMAEERASRYLGDFRVRVVPDAPTLPPRWFRNNPSMPRVPRSPRHPRPRGPRGGTSEPQSILVPADVYTPAQAKQWVKHHGFKVGGYDAPDVRGAYHRFRQFDPDRRHSYRTIPMGKSGIMAVIEVPKTR